jgi:hypothetical protein
LKSILLQKKEIAKAKTYEFTGVVVKKAKEKFSKDNKIIGARKGDEYYKIELDNKIFIYISSFNLDEPDDYSRIISEIMTGEKYMFEVELWVGNRYRLRKLLKKIS